MNKLDEIEDIVSSILEKSEYLLQLSGDNSAEIRMRSIEAINECRNYYDVRERLNTGLSDEDELVRIECLEFIGDTRDIYSVTAVEQLLNDEEWLVRGVAALVLSKIGRDTSKKLIESKVQSADNDEELIRYYISLAVFGLDEYVDKVFSFFNKSSNYRLKCSVANIFEDCIDYLDRGKVLKCLREAWSSEKNEVVRSSFFEAIESISEESQGKRD